MQRSNVASESSVSAQKITVTFGGVDVLSGASIELKPGRVHAITGENGAGKSSLAKVIAGHYQPRLGELSINGQRIRLKSPRDALSSGVALIHQEPMLFPDLTIGENIFAGSLPLGRFGVDWAAVFSMASELLTRVGCNLDPRAKASSLSIANQQRVELASAMVHNPKAWIFDETTAPLTPTEAGQLFEVIRRLKDEGCCIGFVSHHLDEVFTICDEITVLRDGRNVAHFQTTETNPSEVIRSMVGRDIALNTRTRKSSPTEKVLEVKRLCGAGFSDVSVTVRSGEIVAISGLVGAGRTEFVSALFGLTQPTSGSIEIAGKPASLLSPKDAVEAGIGFVPEDRRHNGLMLTRPIRENSSLVELQSFAKSGFITSKLERIHTSPMLSKLRAAMQSEEQEVGKLSGGNQQKVVLSKWLLAKPKLLILDEPTRGIDVQAKAMVHDLIRDLAAEGIAVLMVSSDLPEVLAVSDRIAVMRQGTIVAELDPASATEEDIVTEACRA